MWKSLTDESFVLDIYDNTGYQGDVVTLTGGAHPFITQEDENEDYYTPIRTQSGNIEVLVTDPAVVSDLIPVKATDHQVVLRKDLGGGESEICWVGFISGEMFTQPWEPVPYAATIPVVSVMEAMRGVMFTQDEGISSLKSVMADVVSHIHQVAPSMVYPTFCRADQVYVSNQNFREWVKPATRANLGMGTDKYNCKSLYDVVEEFCKYFGVSLHEDAAQFVFAVHDYSEKQTTYPYYIDDFINSPSFITNMTPEVLNPCGADGTTGYTPAYRRVSGKFATGEGKGLDLFSVGNVWTDYTLAVVYDGLQTETYRSALFNGDTEVVPYLDAMRNVVGPMLRNQAADRCGGQLAYLPGLGSGIWLVSIEGESIHNAMEIAMERPIYALYNKQAAISIDMHAVDQQSSDGTGYTGRVYFKLKVHANNTDYYLATYTGGGSDLINYEWRNADNMAFIQFKDGSIDKDQILQIGLSVDSALNLSFPILTTGPCQVTMMLLCNGNSEFSSVFLDRLDIKYNIQPASSFYTDRVGDENEYCVVNDNSSSQNYDDDAAITTSKSIRTYAANVNIQHGTGIVLDSSYDVVLSEYDHAGIVRRAALFARPREVLTIPTRNRVGSYKNIQMGGQLFVLLARSTDWRDAKTTTKVLRVSLN